MFNTQDLEALKNHIRNSKDAGELTKKVLFYMLDHSQLLTKKIALTFSEKHEIPTDQVATVNSELHNMLSLNHETQLNRFLAKQNKTKLRFTFLYGRYDAEGEFLNDKDEDRASFGTAWIAQKFHEEVSEKIKTDFQMINAVDLGN